MNGKCDENSGWIGLEGPRGLEIQLTKYILNCSWALLLQRSLRLHLDRPTGRQAAALQGHGEMEALAIIKLNARATRPQQITPNATCNPRPRTIFLALANRTERVSATVSWEAQNS